MHDKNCNSSGNVLGTTTGGCCRDKSTCIDVDKIYDSAKDKECIEDLKVYLDNEGQEIVDNASNIRCTCAEVIWAQISVHDIAFNRGYYAVDIRYYFRICFEACVNGRQREFCGIAVYDKQTVMFGSEGNVSIFTSEAVNGGVCGVLPDDSVTQAVSNMPKVVLEVATPICLAVKAVEKTYNYNCNCNCCCCCDQIPQNICNTCGCQPVGDDIGVKCLYVTLGVFSLIRMERPVSLLIDSTEYCVPERESAVLSDSTTDPCTLFKTMSFPTCDFFPPSCGAVSSGIAGGEPCTECPTNCPGGSVGGTTNNNSSCGCSNGNKCR